MKTKTLKKIILVSILLTVTIFFYTYVVKKDVVNLREEYASDKSAEPVKEASQNEEERYTISDNVKDMYNTKLMYDGPPTHFPKYKKFKDYDKFLKDYLKYSKKCSYGIEDSGPVREILGDDLFFSWFIADSLESSEENSLSSIFKKGYKKESEEFIASCKLELPFYQIKKEGLEKIDIGIGDTYLTSLAQGVYGWQYFIIRKEEILYAAPQRSKIDLVEPGKTFSVTWEVENRDRFKKPSCEDKACDKVTTVMTYDPIIKNFIPLSEKYYKRLP